MTSRLVDGNWTKEFAEALNDDASELRIICPFIKAGALQRLLQHNPKEIQVITRFNLGDFAEGVSDVAALRNLLDAGAKVRGVKNLHAKLYLFGKTRAIITSANLTVAALDSNHEFGMVTSEEATVENCLNYFDKLWSDAGSDLQPEQVDNWDRTVTGYWEGGGRPKKRIGLRDFGFSAGIPDAPPVHVPTSVSDAPQAFVKFLGSSKDRLQMSDSISEIIEWEECHWAVCFPKGKRPRIVQDGAIIFLGRFTRNPNDILVIGRAIGMAHRPGRDDASSAEIEMRFWKEDRPHYIRFHHPEFVDGTLENGVSLYELMEALKADSFAPTQRNAAKGKGNTNPRTTYSQQPHVELTAEGFSWLSERLQAAFDLHGKLSLESIEGLDWPDPSTFPSPQS